MGTVLSPPPYSVRIVSSTIRKHVQCWTKDNYFIDPDDLAGACAIASYTLWRVLRRRGHKADFIACYYTDYSAHCWVELTGYIIDLTATQFDPDHPPVRIFPAHKKPKSEYSGTIVKNTKAIKELFENWDSQSPTKYLRKIETLVKNCAK
jgi:hypothetical protein